MILPKELLQRLEEAAFQADSWFAIYSKLRELVPDGEELTYRGLVWAFAFDLIHPADAERRLREGSPFGAFVEFEQGRIPPRLGDVPEQDVASWREALDAIEDPKLVSRLGDLLWERRDQPRPDVAGRRASRALLELAGSKEWSSMAKTDGLVRALEIARELSDPDLEAQAVATLVEQADAELAASAERPGVTFNLLGALVDLPAARRPPALAGLIARSEQVYGADPYHVESAIELAVALAPVDDLPALRTRQVLLWREEGRKAAGILRPAFLERALDLATTHGLPELARELRVELQSITEEELDLKEFSAEVKVPSEEVDAFIGHFVRFDSWTDSLAAFGIHGPPGGEPEVIEERVAQMKAAHPLQFLVTRTVIDADLNVAIFHARDDAGHTRAAIAHERLFASRIWASLAVEVLERFIEKYGRPSDEDLADAFTTAIIGPATAASIAHAFSLYFKGAHDDAAHVLAPRLETVVRELARQLGLPIIREPVGEEPGRWRSLGDLLYNALPGRLPTPGWHGHLINLLIDPLGLNLRNVIAHGVRERIDRSDVVLLLHAACFLRLVALSPSAEAST